MPRAVPLTLSQWEALKLSDYPDWDYMPGGNDAEPFEYKRSDWGYLGGKMVALDYSMPAHLTPAEKADLINEAMKRHQQYEGE